MPVLLLKSQKQPPRDVPKKKCSEICSKFTGEHPCKSMVSVKLLCNIIEITLWYECSPVNLLHIFRTRFTKNTSGWLLLKSGYVRGFIQAILISGRRHKKLNFLIEFLNLIFIKFYFKASWCSTCIQNKLAYQASSI